MQTNVLEKIENIDEPELRRIASHTRERSAKPPRKPRLIYADQIMCFIALTFMATWRSGPRALLLVCVSVLTSIIVDFICCKMSKKEYTYRDLSNISAGMCIALMMPASVSYTTVGAGAALAIGIKHIFGGKDNYIFNPTAVTLAFLIICYPTRMLLFPMVGEQLPVFGEVTTTLASGIENFILKLGTAQEISPLDILLGNFQGPMGTTHILVILVCGICLLFRRSISGLVTLTSMSIILIIASIFPIYEDFGNTLAYEMIGGYMLFGLLFLANDPQTLPKTSLAKVYYGILLGVMTVVFRYFGKVEGSFAFALLAANALSSQTDVIADATFAGIHRFSAYLKKSLSSYELIKETVAETETKSIGDTQEIEIHPTNYDMPPIDNKVTKINRKKPNLLKKTQERIGTLAEKKDTKQQLAIEETPTQEEAEPKLELRRALKLARTTARPTKERFLAFFHQFGKGENPDTPEEMADSEIASASNSATKLSPLSAHDIAEAAGQSADNSASTTKKTIESKKTNESAEEDIDIDNASDIEIVDFEEVAELTVETKSVIDADAEEKATPKDER